MDSASVAVMFAEFIDAVEELHGPDADIRMIFVGAEIDNGESLGYLTGCNDDRRYVQHAFLDEMHDQVGYPSERVEDD